MNILAVIEREYRAEPRLQAWGGIAPPTPLWGLGSRLHDRPRRRLVPREEWILAARYDEGLTFDEIGQKLGVTGTRAREVYNRAVWLLRRHSDNWLEFEARWLNLEVAARLLGRPYLAVYREASRGRWKARKVGERWYVDAETMAEGLA